MKNKNGSKNKTWKLFHEKKYQSMVFEYQEASKKLALIDANSSEYVAQENTCKTLFDNAKSFFYQNQ